jgi:HKD family nuclease
MLDALINALSSSDKVDIEVGFFYFSGWQLLAKHLKDKKVRILVGKYIDPKAVPELLQKIRLEGQNVELDPFQPRQTISSRTAKKQTYIDGFLRLSNESALLDDSVEQEAYKILESKIADGSLEIKLSNRCTLSIISRSLAKTEIIRAPYLWAPVTLLFRGC